MASQKIDDIYEFLDIVDEYIQMNTTDKLDIINDYSYYAFDKFGNSILFLIASNPENLRRDNNAYKRTVELIRNVIQYYKKNRQMDKLNLGNKYNVPPFGELTLHELMEKYEMPLLISGGYKKNNKKSRKQNHKTKHKTKKNKGNKSLKNKLNKKHSRKQKLRHRK